MKGKPEEESTTYRHFDLLGRGKQERGEKGGIQSVLCLFIDLQFRLLLEEEKEMKT